MATSIEQALAEVDDEGLDIEQALSEFDEPPTGGEAFMQSASIRFVNNILATPSAFGDFIAAGSAGARSLVDFDFSKEGFDQRFAEEQQAWPARDIRAIPRPTVAGIGAAVQSIPSLLPGGKKPSEAFAEEKAGFEAFEERMHEAAPIATGAGEIAGDVATIATGRMPFAKGINKAETAFMNPRPDILFSSTAKALDDIPPGAMRLLDRFVKSNTLRTLGRGTGRAAETGFEAMVLDIINGDDPLETAMYAAGLQAGGSVALQGTKGILSGGPTKAGMKVAVAAVATGSLIQLLKDTIPGGHDSIIDSTEIGYEKVLLGLSLGLAASMTGAGRARGGKLAEDLPRLSDVVTTIPRGTMISILENWADAPPDEQQSIEAALAALAENPQAFDEETLNQIEQAIDDEQLFEVLQQIELPEGPQIERGPFFEGPR